MAAESVRGFEQGKSAYCFGPFRLEPSSGLLFRDNQPISLSPKTFDALLYLAEHSGQLVTKDELIRALWADAFVSESNLTQTIFVLRKALSSAGNAQGYITTVPGRGYRFDAEVERVASERGVRLGSAPACTASEPPSASPPSPLVRDDGVRQWSGRSRRIQATVVLLLVATSSACLLWWLARDRLAQASGRKMLAVLPFENLTGDPGQDYFSAGFTEEMITQLGRLDPVRVGVIARTSVERYKQNPVPVEQIRRDLGVEYVLEGSVRRNAEQVRITAQLIRANDQTHLWAGEYDREVKDLLQLQGEIAHEIVDEIETKLRPPLDRGVTHVGRGAADYEAYDLYLKGRYFWDKRTPQGFQQSISLFQRATERQPGYARAYAGLADAYAMMSSYGLAPANDYMPKARSAALRALQIDDSLAEAHTSLGVIAENYDYDWQTAEKEFRRAIELNSNYATAHQWYAECLAFQGRFDEALAESELARRLDPLSLIITADDGAILYFSRNYDRAIERFRGVLEMDPGVTRAHLLIAAYVQKGQFQDALADIEYWRRTSGDAPWIWAWQTYVFGRGGDRLKAQRSFAKLRELNRNWRLEPDQYLGVVYAGTADKDKWLAWLENAYQNHSNVITDLKVNPLYDPLRNEPRFQKLLRRVRLDR